MRFTPLLSIVPYSDLINVSPVSRRSLLPERGSRVLDGGHTRPKRIVTKNLSSIIKIITDSIGKKESTQYENHNTDSSVSIWVQVELKEGTYPSVVTTTNLPERRSYT